ncbi:hypothetical protein ACGC1H_005970 [Rhizoctonia solani]
MLATKLLFSACSRQSIQNSADVIYLTEIFCRFHCYSTISPETNLYKPLLPGNPASCLRSLCPFSSYGLYQHSYHTTMHCSILSFVTLLVVASTAAAQPTKRLISINPPQNLRVNLTALPPVEVAPKTNAKRFAQGLPPLSPVKRHPHRGGPHRDGGNPHKGTRVAFAPRAEVSAAARTKVKCNILVKPTSGSTLGYISPIFNDFGEYGPLQTSQAGALEIAFSNTASSGLVYGPADFLTTNNVDTINSFPYLSAGKYSVFYDS